VIFALFCILGYTQDANDRVENINTNDVAKIIRLLASDIGLGNLIFIDNQNMSLEGKVFWGLSKDDRLLLVSNTLSPTMMPSIGVIELSNPDQDDKALTNYIDRLRETGWKHYIGDAFSFREKENSDVSQARSFYVV
jgi:hypothetical protein